MNTYLAAYVINKKSQVTQVNHPLCKCLWKTTWKCSSFLMILKCKNKSTSFRNRQFMRRIKWNSIKKKSSMHNFFLLISCVQNHLKNFFIFNNDISICRCILKIKFTLFVFIQTCNSFLFYIKWKYKIIWPTIIGLRKGLPH